MSVRPKAAQVPVRADATAPSRQPLKFGQGNAKLSQAVTTFSIVAGYSCPFARECLSKSDRNTGSIKDGRHIRLRCYATTMEARRPSVRRARWHNYNLLRSCASTEEMAQLILDSLTPFARLVRVHDAGDYFSLNYFDAWVQVARQRPSTVCYWYSKALPYWVKRLDVVGDGHKPGEVSNIVPTASWGGTHDHLITRYGLRSARVVFSQAEADELGLEVDHDDSHAMHHGPNYALLVHGTQPPGSSAGKAVRALRDAGWTGYGTRTRIPLVSFGPVVSSEPPR